jgi:DHA1 family bicyclomycin/chloramphenicol resistance-like MFS transporter
MGIGVVLLASHFGLPHTLNQILRFRWNQNQLFLIFWTWWENLSFILMHGAIAFSGLFTYVAASILFYGCFLSWCHNVRMDFAFMSLSFISASQLNSILLRNLAVSKWFSDFDCAICY